MTINKLTVFHLILLPNEPTAQLELESAVTEKVVFALFRDNGDNGAPGARPWAIVEGKNISFFWALDFDTKSIFDSVVSHVNVNYCFHNFDWTFRYCMYF